MQTGHKQDSFVENAVIIGQTKKPKQQRRINSGHFTPKIMRKNNVPPLAQVDLLVGRHQAERVPLAVLDLWQAILEFQGGLSNV